MFYLKTNGCLAVSYVTFHCNLAFGNLFVLISCLLCFCDIYDPAGSCLFVNVVSVVHKNQLTKATAFHI